MTAQTPMMRQYLEIKSRYPDSILFFRLGDFYEMFLDDAVTASRILDIALTSRNKNKESGEEVPLCGIPYHSAQPYLAKLVAAGHKVAICEQVEDPKSVKGIVRRDVVRVVTPGTVLEAELLAPDRNNFLLAISFHLGVYGLSSIDLSTGQFRVTQADDLDIVRRELVAIDPCEILLAQDTAVALQDGLRTLLAERSVGLLPDGVFDPDDAAARLKRFYAIDDLGGFGCAALPAAIAAAGAVLYYLEHTQKSGVGHLHPLQTYHVADSMVLDETTRRNLELTETLSGARRKGSLLGALDRTITAMGGRTLRHWLTRPLIECDQIRYRHELIQECVEHPLVRQDLRAALDGVYDLERLIGRIAMGSANAKDLCALRHSLQRVPQIRLLFSQLESPLALTLYARIDPLEEVVGLLERAIAEEPPFVLREGGLIRSGYHEELDELRQICREGKGWIARLEKEEREQTGISALKVRYNRVFGYYIDIPKTQLAKVPDRYERKQTLANSERYFTPQLKEYEDKVLGAEEKMVTLEYELFQQVRAVVATHHVQIQSTAEALASLDVLLSLADVAHERNYCCPLMDEGTRLLIEDGRHPVIETMDLGEPFVANDVELDTQGNQLLMITGPNMAGKSTFMRQVALITLMAQVGSFVPAKSATIGIVDRIFTRVGASDNLARGQSTFMVEMSETANILNHATVRSLIVLDEIGRGTSTFDGVSIAWAVAEYLHDNRNVAAKTLFATHYHELADLSRTREGIRNYNIAVREWNDQIVFLRKIVPGSASHSYGIQVARLAGLPSVVIARAKEVLAKLEQGEFTREGLPVLAGGQNFDSGQAKKEQMSLFSDLDDPVRQQLKHVDVHRMTPLEALNFIDELKKLL